MKTLETISYIEEFTGVRPDIVAMDSGGDPSEWSSEQHLQKIYRDELLAGNDDGVRQLETQCNIRFAMDDDELQIFYAMVLDAKINNKDTVVEFIISNTNVTPAPEMILAYYTTSEFDAQDIELLRLLVSRNESFSQVIDQIDIDKASKMTPANAIKYVKYLKSVMAELFPNSYEQAFELINSQLANDDDIADAMVENFSQFNFHGSEALDILKRCANHYSTAQKIDLLDLSLYLDNDETSELLNFIDSVIPKFPGEYLDDGWVEVRDDNPHAATAGDMEHITSTRPGQDTHRLAVEISRGMRQGSEQYRVVAGAARQAFDELEADIATEYGDMYAEQIFGKHKTSGTWSNYRRLVADYIALSGGSVDHTDLTSALAGANTAFKQVLSVDTIYYDKLFKEWDAKRIGQRDFQEVFLGRDGVYAYVARRAQMWARQSRVGLRRNGAISASQVDLPTYLVYPRGFRDGLTDETKRTYLNQEIANPDAAHYYDTGFTGTIPEDIMRILGVDQQDWDARIRLLSATKRDRTVLGLEGSKNERDQIVNTVEHNVKDEETAAGLYLELDGNNNERLVPYAVPTSPTERLAFRFTQLALHRHYYAREFEAMPETALLFDAQELGDAKEMRMSSHYRPETTERLRAIFASDDIGMQLLKEATALKMANPEDPYPNEAVFELDTADGDLIVKAVVSEKQKGPIDEFEALLLLERLGIDVPHAVARVFTDGQQGFVVMEKLSGTSGRTIKHYFEEHNISEENQKNILFDARERMRTIAEQVRKDVGLDKPWRFKDFMIEFEADEKGGIRIAAMKPIDFERAGVFDPINPHTIRLGQNLDELLP